MSKSAAAKKVKAAKPELPVVVAFKGFDANLCCRGFQYAIGETYTHDGPVEICKQGFHACENPLDVLNYYDPCDSRFALIEATGEIAREDCDTKFASAKITIKAELKLPGFVSAAVAWMLAACKAGAASAASGDDSKLAASGHYSQLAASGDSSQLAASGYYSIACTAGPNSRVKAGANGAMSLARWVSSEKRYRITVAYVGENGIKADVWYALDEAGNFSEVKS